MEVAMSKCGSTQSYLPSSAYSTSFRHREITDALEALTNDLRCMSSSSESTPTSSALDELMSLDIGIRNETSSSYCDTTPMVGSAHTSRNHLPTPSMNPRSMCKPFRPIALHKSKLYQRRAKLSRGHPSLSPSEKIAAFERKLGLPALRSN
eukprot:m.35755 g.35755  ORF g.35755 m.35755 type:complete len:151 (+) comp17197_c1_seq1:347-799(+)